MRTLILSLVLLAGVAAYGQDFSPSCRGITPYDVWCYSGSSLPCEMRGLSTFVGIDGAPICGMPLVRPTSVYVTMSGPTDIPAAPTLTFLFQPPTWLTGSVGDEIVAQKQRISDEDELVKEQEAIIELRDSRIQELEHELEIQLEAQKGGK